MTKDQLVQGLHPELASYVECHPMFGYQIRHPLMIVLGLDPENNELLNKRFEMMSQYRNKCWQDQKYNAWVFAHERPFRFEAYLLHVHGTIEPEEDAKLLLDLWTDIECPNNAREEFDDCFHALKDTAVMRNTRTELSFPLTVYRGFHCQDYDDLDDHAKALSWTTNKETARYFAHRFASMNDDTPHVATYVIENSDEVYAFDDSRNESEVVLSLDKKGAGNVDFETV